MKTKEEMRFEAALFALQGTIANSNADIFRMARDSAKRHGDKSTQQTFAREAVEYADALLAELDRTATKPEMPSPDADGWIAHRPGDPMPCDGLTKVRIKRRDGKAENICHASFFDTDEDGSNWWTGEGMRDPGTQIIAWKPA